MTLWMMLMLRLGLEVLGIMAKILIVRGGRRDWRSREEIRAKHGRIQEGRRVPFLMLGRLLLLLLLLLLRDVCHIGAKLVRIGCLGLGRQSLCRCEL